jgi:double zinc ribbon protein
MPEPSREYVQPQAYDSEGHPLPMDHVADDVAAGKAFFQKGARVYALNPSGTLVTIDASEVQNPGYRVLTPTQLHDEHAKRHLGERLRVVNVDEYDAPRAAFDGPPAAVIGEVFGLALAALFWPWLFGKFARAVGAKRSAAWTGYLLAVLGAAGVASVTAYPGPHVALFALFGLGWTAWLSRPKAEADTPEEADDAPDDSALRDLIDSIEAKPTKFKATSATSGLATSPKQGPAPTSRECEACGERNDPDAEHCVACGKGLRERTCPACQQVNVAKARFCKRCGGELGNKREGAAT